MFDLGPNDVLSQGDIVAKLSAHGYEKSETYGLIITARCDFAHDKANVINYVPVVPIADWYDRAGWQRPASQEEDQVAAQLVQEAARCLKQIEIEQSEIRVSVQVYGGKATVELIEQNSSKVSDKARKLGERLDVLRDCIRKDKRVPEVPEKLVTNLLRDLQSHRLADLYYLPLNFVASDETQSAHVALLRQIYAIPATSLAPAAGVAGVSQRANTAGPLPPLSISSSLPLGRVARMVSPYTEHFLQRLTLLFARVGVDDVQFKNIEQLTKAIR